MVQRTVSVGLIANVNNFVAGMTRAQEATRKTAAAAAGSEAQLRKQSEAFDRVGKAAAGMGAVAAVGLALVVKASTEFQGKMAQLQSLSHAGADTMKQLAEQAMHAGTAYGFSATQVADAQIEMTKAGVSTKAILGGALTGALTLAAAGQLDVARATEITTVAMTQFGLSAKDVPHLADLLSAGADKALGSVGDLGEALKNGGLQAHNMGMTIDQTVGLLSAFANSGTLGAEAGTQMRSMFIALQKPHAAALKTMREYNISLNDSQGKFIGVAALGDELRQKLGKLTQAQRNQALATIFGSHAITGATVLYQDSGKAAEKAGTSIADWTKAVNDSGFADAQAQGKLNSLQGDVQKLGAAFQTDLIQAGTDSQGSLRGIVQAGTGLLNFVGGMPQPLQNAGVEITALVAGVGLLGGAALIAVPKIVAFRGALEEAGVSGRRLGGILGRGGVLLAGVGALTAGFASMEEQGTATSQQIERAGISIGKHWGDVNKLFGSAGSQIGSGSGLKDSLDNITGALGPAAAAKFADAATGLLTLGLAQTHLGDVYKANEGTFAAMGEQLAGLAKTDYGKATESFAGLTREYKLNAGEQASLLSHMPAFRDELVTLAGKAGVGASDQQLLALAMRRGADAAKVAAVASAEAAASADQQNTAIAKLQGSAASAQQSVKDLASAIKGLGSVQLDADSAAIAFQQAIADASKTINGNTKTLDISTQAGRDNKRALDGIASAATASASAVYTQTGSWQKAAAVVQAGREAFVQQAEKITGSRKAAERLADALDLIPANVKSIVDVQTGAAQTAIDKIKAAMGNLDGTTADVYVSLVEQGLSTGRAAQSAKNSRLAFADGGSVTGSGPKGVDSVRAVLAPGEHVLTARDVDAMGGQSGVYAFRAALHMATGGAVSSAANAVDAAQRALSRARTARARETAQENLGLAQQKMTAAIRQAGEDFVSQQRRAALNPIDPLNYVDQLRSMSRDTAWSATNRATFDREANRYESALVRLRKASDAASTKLDGLRQASSQLAASVSSSIAGRYTLSGAGQQQIASGWITRNGIRMRNYSTGYSAAGIASYYRAGAASSAHFAAQIKTLARRGLSAGLLAQLAQDPDGPKMADALMSASAAQIRSIDAGYAGINRNANAAGKTVADDTYGKSIQEQTKVLKSLQAQEKTDAEKLRHLIARALGVKGYATGTGSATPGLHWVGEDGPELLRFAGGESVLSASASRAYVRGTSRGPAQIVVQAPRVVMPDTITVQDAHGFRQTMRVVAHEVAAERDHHIAVSLQGISR